jgi:hypothetical protein
MVGGEVENTGSFVEIQRNKTEIQLNLQNKYSKKQKYSEIK